MNLFVNPLSSVLFVPIVIRLVILFAVGGIAIMLVAHRNSSIAEELWTRYRSWAFIAPIFLVSVFCGTLPAVLIFCAIMFRAVKEFGTVADLSTSHRTVLTLLVPVSFAVALTSVPMSVLPPLYLLVFTLVALKSNKREALHQLAIGLFGAFWLVYLMLHAPLLRQSENGILLICLTGSAVALSDIGSYTLGGILHKKGLGNRFKVASNISPNKTFPGYIGAVIGVILILGLYAPLYSQLSTVLIVLMPIVIPFASAVGDLGESLFKRFFEVKDSSAVIPGHGGVLDRLDSFIPSVTALYYLNMVL